jgi:hypothetical protein
MWVFFAGKCVVKWVGVRFVTIYVRIAPTWQPGPKTKFATPFPIPKSTHRLDEQEFHSKSAAHFMFFKDAWRNHVMHGGRSYES